MLVSEVMAQQTQVDRVVPKWRALLDRWPTATLLASAPLAELLRLWTGLGYPRRAGNLHRAAGLIVERHEGEVPDDLDELLALPGVGAYTARAVLAFAFEQHVGVVDTNVARVLARAGGSPLTAREAQRTADAWVAAADPWTWNQSIMEVGALHCRPVPRCEGCPFAGRCSWAGAGWVEPDPAEGSAGVSRAQARFLGSDREARGRLLAAVLAAPVAPTELTAAAGLGDDVDRARRVAAALAADGLVVRRGDGAWVPP